jgi:hypothetical protein
MHVALAELGSTSYCKAWQHVLLYSAAYTTESERGCCRDLQDAQAAADAARSENAATAGADKAREAEEARLAQELARHAAHLSPEHLSACQQTPLRAWPCVQAGAQQLAYCIDAQSADKQVRSSSAQDSACLQ